MHSFDAKLRVYYQMTWQVAKLYGALLITDMLCDVFLRLTRFLVILCLMLAIGNTQAL